MNNQSRWYKIIGGITYVFDSGYEDKATSVSIIPSDDLSYYRTNFHLRKLWGKIQ